MGVVSWQDMNSKMVKFAVLQDLVNVRGGEKKTESNLQFRIQEFLLKMVKKKQNVVVVIEVCPLKFSGSDGKAIPLSAQNVGNEQKKARGLCRKSLPFLFGNRAPIRYKREFLSPL